MCIKFTRVNSSIFERVRVNDRTYHSIDRQEQVAMINCWRQEEEEEEREREREMIQYSDRLARDKSEQTTKRVRGISTADAPDVSSAVHCQLTLGIR